MYSDEELTAYLDGELPDNKTQEITAALAADADLAARLAALDIDIACLKSAFHSLPVPEINLPTTKPRWILPALAASVVLALGIGIGVSLLAPKTGWEVEVAHYQALYVTDTLIGIKPDAERLAQQIATVNQLLGLEMNTEDLNGFDGMTLRRAQVLGFEGQVLIQIAYTMDDGTPVAFCILKRQNSVDRPVSSTELIGQAVATWQTTDHGFLTIGGTDQKLMADFARHLAAVL